MILVSPPSTGLLVPTGPSAGAHCLRLAWWQAMRRVSEPVSADT